jgi:hypothetical protein
MRRIAGSEGDEEAKTYYRARANLAGRTPSAAAGSAVAGFEQVADV